MKELKEKVSELINAYFDKKIDDVDWRYDISAENKAKDIIREAIEDVMYSLDSCDDSIDEHLEAFEDMHSNKPGQYWEDLTADNFFRENELLVEGR